MLVLSRKTGERVIVADGIQITVVAVKGNKVRLGFLAPEDTVIRRGELCFDAPLLENQDDGPDSATVNTVPDSVCTD
jgi:carbon storage regulator